MIQDCGATAIKGPVIHPLPTKLSGFSCRLIIVLDMIACQNSLQEEFKILFKSPLYHLLWYCGFIGLPLTFFFFLFFLFFKGPGRLGPFIQEKWKVRKNAAAYFHSKTSRTIADNFFLFSEHRINRPKRTRKELQSNENDFLQKEHEKSSDWVKTIFSEKDTKTTPTESKRSSPKRTREVL